MPSRVDFPVSQNGGKQLLHAATFAILLIVSGGYRYGTGGGNVAFLPVIEALRGDSGLAADFNILAYEHYHRFFDLACVMLSRVVALPALFLAGYLFTGALFYLAISSLARVLFGDSRVAPLTAALLLIWGSSGMEVNSFWYSAQFAPYMLAWPFGLFAAAAMWRGRALLCGALLGIACLVHVQFGVGFAAALLAASALERRGRDLGLCMAAAGIVSLPAALQLISLGTGGDLPAGETFLNQAAFRSPHHFEIQPRNFVGISLALAACCLAFQKLRGRFELQTAVAARAILLCLIIYLFALAHYFDFYLLRSGIIARLQLPRLTPFIQLIAVAATARAMLALLERERAGAALAAALGLFLAPLWLATGYFAKPALLFCVSASALVYANARSSDGAARIREILLATIALKAALTFTFTSRYFVYDARAMTSDPWIEACEWISRHTRPDARFVTPPDREGFPLYARRAMIADYFTNPHQDSHITEWRRRISALSGGRPLNCSGWECLPQLKRAYESLEGEEIALIAARYGAQYIVATGHLNPDLREIYSNAEVRVYEVGAGGG